MITTAGWSGGCTVNSSSGGGGDFLDDGPASSRDDLFACTCLMSPMRALTSGTCFEVSFPCTLDLPEEVRGLVQAFVWSKGEYIAEYQCSVLLSMSIHIHRFWYFVSCSNFLYTQATAENTQKNKSFSTTVCGSSRTVQHSRSMRQQ